MFYYSTNPDAMRPEEPEVIETLAPDRQKLRVSIERKGRGGELCKHIGVAHGFISQITNQVRPCSKERYEQIKLAMKTIEQREQAA